MLRVKTFEGSAAYAEDHLDALYRGVRVGKYGLDVMLLKDLVFFILAHELDNTSMAWINYTKMLFLDLLVHYSSNSSVNLPYFYLFKNIRFLPLMSFKANDSKMGIINVKGILALGEKCYENVYDTSGILNLQLPKAKKEERGCKSI